MSSAEISSEVIARVWRALEAFAAAEKLPAFSDIEASVGVKFRQDQWHQVLDPIYEELRAAGEPDLTAIIVYKAGEKAGYPAYFSDGGEARSRRFNPNKRAQLKRWTEEVTCVFAKYRK
jgi:hypothetical protein